jgi:hypothetical protein
MGEVWQHPGELEHHLCRRWRTRSGQGQWRRQRRSASRSRSGPLEATLRGRERVLDAFWPPEAYFAFQARTPSCGLGAALSRDGLFCPVNLIGRLRWWSAGDPHPHPDSIEGETASAPSGVIATRGSWTGSVRRQGGIGVDARLPCRHRNWPFVDLPCRGRDADGDPDRRQLSPEFGDQLPGTYRF